MRRTVNTPHPRGPQRDLRSSQPAADNGGISDAAPHVHYLDGDSGSCVTCLHTSIFQNSAVDSWRHPGSPWRRVPPFERLSAPGKAEVPLRVKIPVWEGRMRSPTGARAIREPVPGASRRLLCRDFRILTVHGRTRGGPKRNRGRTRGKGNGGRGPPCRRNSAPWA